MPGLEIRGLRYHHLGVPTDVARPGEEHLEALGVHVVPWERNPFGVEFMRFEPACAVPEVVRRVPHLAFEVDDLDAALVGREILIAPNSPSGGVRVAFISHDGLPVELMQFTDPDDPRRSR
jgi:catechol 2,3-dioxygenase-like lactoylglutathione lyase family enzyme